MSRRIDNLRALVRQQVSIIDELLAERGIAVPERCWRAACFIAEHCIVEVEGHNTSEYMTSAWFGAVYWPVREWYGSRYGRRILDVRSLATSRLGLALFRGSLFQLEIPLCLHRPSPIKGCFEIHFPQKVENDEDLIGMMAPMPDRRSLRSPDRKQLASVLSDIVGFHRRLWNLTVPVKDALDGRHDLRGAMLDQLDGVATRALLLARNSLRLGLFDLRMCCELVLKVHLLQRNGVFDRVHDFQKLLTKASDEIRDLYRTELPGALAEYRTVNGYRYGEVAAVTAVEFFTVYKSALAFLERGLQFLSRDVTLSGMVCTMKKVPWAEAGPEAFHYE